MQATYTYSLIILGLLYSYECCMTALYSTVTAFVLYSFLHSYSSELRLYRNSICTHLDIDTSVSTCLQLV